MTVKQLRNALTACPDDAQIYLWDRRENPKTNNARDDNSESSLRIFKVGGEATKILVVQDL